MTGQALKQRLAAILAADAADYSRLMAADELKRTAPAYRFSSWSLLSIIRRPKARERVCALIHDASIPE